MPLAPGVRLGVYEVLELIGAGGMGEVYRGRDARLTRDVALKILPELFALDPDRLARFKREAQLLASVNHSNIAAIYGFEESNGVQALVLELVDGPTLADRIAQGPLPLDEALPIAVQIAEALEAAHARGIVHRDLKPANIKVRADGTVKVLDFGLAKALADEVAKAEQSGSPTITSPAATRMGVILGTAAYMSPEQARGKVVDKRSDIWAFGGVLYEMLTGKRAFDGDEVSDTLANVLKTDPDWAALPAGTPSSVERVLRRCLEKDPGRRFHDAADVRLDLDEKAGPEAVAAVPVDSRVKRRERFAWALVAALLAGFLAYMLLKEPPPAQVVQFQVNAPENTFLDSAASGQTSSGMISPDGTRLVFAATDAAGKSLLWIRPVDSFTARPLAGTDGASLPFWSPDGRSIGFFVTGKLKRMDAAGGTLQTVCDVPGASRGGTWGTSGVILFSSVGSPRISRVSDQGGQAVPVTTPDEGRKEFAHFWPSFLPDGRHFLYVVNAPLAGVRDIYVGSIDSSPPTRLLASNTNAVYVPPGFLLFVNEGTLFRQRFDPKSLTVAGERTPVAERVSYVNSLGVGAFSASATGVLTFRSTADVSTQFAWFDRDGRMLQRVGPPGHYRTPALSPDEKRLAYTDVSQGGDRGEISILDLSSLKNTRFTFNLNSHSPVWSPDGARIMYRSSQDGGSVFEKNASGSGTERLLLKTKINGPSQVSPKNNFLLYFAFPAGPAGLPNLDVQVLPLTGERTPRPIVQTLAAEVEPQFSPDERWLAYASNETGRNEIFVQPFPPTGERWQVSTNGGRQPIWRQDGKELFFASEERKLYAVDIRADSVFGFEAPRLLFDLRAEVVNTGRSYLPTRDGQRFLVNMLLDSSPSPIHVIVNWTAGLK